MKLKKITSIICSAAMALSILSMPAAANTAVSEKYLIVNDQFGNGDFGGWVQHKNSDSSYGSLTTTVVSGDNYALLYETTSDNWLKDFIKREMPGGEIQLAGGVDIVVETKIKLASQGGNDTRLFFKYNLTDSVVEDQPQPEYNVLWGNLFMNQKGDVSLHNGWGIVAQYNYYSYPYGFGGTGAKDGNQKVIEGATDNWYTYKLVFHGGTAGANHTATGNTVDFYIYDEGGTEVVKKLGFDIDFPDNSSWGWSGSTVATNMNWVEDVINNFAFKTRNCGKLYVDYFKVWQEGVKVTSVTSEADLKNIKVKLTSNGAILGGIADYLKLYEPDGVTEADVTKAYDINTKTLTFTSQTDLPAGTIYKVKADKAAILADMKITWEALEEINVEAPACVAVNPTIKGELVPGTELEADYDLLPEGAEEGASVFEWYTVAPDGTKTAIGGQTGKTFAVTTDYVDSVITYSVIPKCVVGGIEKTGLVTECSETVTPLSVPVVTNPGYVQSSVMIDYDLEAKYDYSDADGDEEAGSIITWYAGSAADSDDYDDFGTGKSVKITADLNGKYIKYSVQPKNNAAFRETGEIVWSTAIGPAADVVTASNMFTNADLESGEITPWTFGASDGYKGIEITDMDAHSGTYSILAHPRMTVNRGWGQNVTLEEGRMYIISAMIKSATSESYTGYEGHLQGGSTYRPFRNEEMTTVSPDEWVRVSLTFYTKAGGSYRLGFKSDHMLDSTVYVDDAYVSELMISDIKTRDMEPVTVPKGDEKVTVNVLSLDANGNAVLYNQLGEQDGLTKQTALVTVDDYPGVSVVDNKIVIDSDAVAGKVNVEVKCVPDYTCSETVDGKISSYNPTPAQTEFVKTLELELVPHESTAPEARNVDATGTVITGNTLYGSYNFYQVEGRENASTVRWLCSDTENGTYTAIPGATGMSYFVGAAYVDKFIKFEVTPKTADGLEGAPVTSVALTKPTAPVAKNVAISGDFKVGGTINGSYDFYDANRDAEGTTTFKWYAADSADGTYSEIAGATTSSLVLTSDLTDKYIKLGVTAVSESNPKIGAEVLSDAYTGPVAPVAKDVTITVDGNRLTGNYTYYHEHNARELSSIYKWTVDGTVVSTTTSYVADFAGVKTVTFTVTPVGDTNPGTGMSVSVSAVINGTQGTTGGNTPVGGIVSGGGSFGGGGSGGGGASGGGGSSAIAGGVTSINDKNYAEETKPAEDEKEPEGSDLDGHWGEEYIKKMEERGVMSADENGKYNPDELVNREDMLTYLFKALKLEKAEYSGMFSDVADGEFADMLQAMVDNGTISVDTNFRPGDSISREEMCKILCISLVNAGKMVEEVGNPAVKFADYDEISDWALQYVNAIYSIKMMIGVSDDRFAPKENVTKAQAATMLTRVISWVEGE